jgi:hypothetical protein
VISPEPLEVELPNSEPQLVISATTIQPFGSVILVSRSFDALTVKDTIDFNSSTLLDKILVSNAIVEITYNSKKIVLKEIFRGIYGSVELEYLENINYDLYVKDPSTGLEATASTQYVDNLVDFELVQKNYDTIYSFTSTWSDESNRNYLIASNKLTSNLNLFKNVDHSFLKLFSSNYALYDASNKNNNGKYEHKPFYTPYVKGDTIIVSLSAINLDYYSYLTAYKKSGSILNQILAEPIRTLPTNVNNGLGYFALYGTKSKILILE